MTPFHKAVFPALLIPGLLLAGCANRMPPPEIQYDTAVPAVRTIDPPPPVTVVPIPDPLPLPGQLLPVVEATVPPEPANPTLRVSQANAAARVQPKVYIEFPSGIAQGEMPPLFVVGPTGGGDLVNYRVRRNYLIIDRLFAAAELRIGDGDSERRVRISRTDGKSRS